MFIHCWGSRGSIPVSGPDFYKYGGDTTCVEVRTEDDPLLIIDAGSGLRQLGNLLVKEEKYHIHLLLTHLHFDHLIGLLFFQPLYSNNTQIHIYGSPYKNQSFESTLSSFFSPPYSPISLSEIKADLIFHELNQKTFKIESTTISTIPLNHPGGGLGYRIQDNGKHFVFITDNELRLQDQKKPVFEDYVDFTKDADLLFHDAEYLEAEYAMRNGWGHSCYKDTLNLAIRAHVRKFGLFHHNQNRSDDALDVMVRDCHEKIQQEKSELRCFAVASGVEIEL